VVKNQRPKDRSLQERQARNWRARAIDALKAYAQRKGKTPKALSASPPDGDEEYDTLWLDYRAALAYAKYVKHTDNALSIVDWRNANLQSADQRSAILRGEYLAEQASLDAEA
jgi:uncharacterized protein YjbI with pentapeptide repeats